MRFIAIIIKKPQSTLLLCFGILAGCSCTSHCCSCMECVRWCAVESWNKKVAPGGFDHTCNLCGRSAGRPLAPMCSRNHSHPIHLMIVDTALAAIVGVGVSESMYLMTCRSRSSFQLNLTSMRVCTWHARVCATRFNQVGEVNMRHGHRVMVGHS